MQLVELLPLFQHGKLGSGEYVKMALEQIARAVIFRCFPGPFSDHNCSWPGSTEGDRHCPGNYNPPKATFVWEAQFLDHVVAEGEKKKRFKNRDDGWLPWQRCECEHLPPAMAVGLDAAIVNIM